MRGPSPLDAFTSRIRIDVSQVIGASAAVEAALNNIDKTTIFLLAGATGADDRGRADCVRHIDVRKSAAETRNRLRCDDTVVVTGDSNLLPRDNPLFVWKVGGSRPTESAPPSHLPLLVWLNVPALEGVGSSRHGSAFDAKQRNSNVPLRCL